MTTIRPTRVAGQPSRWKWFLALGVLLVLLGLAAAGATTLLQLSSLLVFGPLLLVSSLLQFLTAFFAEKGRETLLHMTSAGLEAVLGLFIMAQPFVGIADVAAVVGIVLVATGLVRLARALIQHTPGRNWIVLAGSGALVLGVCVWLKLPVSALWFVGLCMAVDFLCHGVSWTAIALAEGRPLDQSFSC